MKGRQLSASPLGEQFQEEKKIAICDKKGNSIPNSRGTVLFIYDISLKFCRLTPSLYHAMLFLSISIL
jgi:hypothetical protein